MLEACLRYYTLRCYSRHELAGGRHQRRHVVSVGVRCDEHKCATERAALRHRICKRARVGIVPKSARAIDDTHAPPGYAVYLRAQVGKCRPGRC
eukprot:PRCOL_00001808-RA